MQTILVPIDFSEDSLNALHMAINVAKASQAEVKMIHVNKTRMFLSFVRAKPTENPEDIKRDFTDLISHTAHEGVNLDYVIRDGQVSKEICHYAEEVEATMIIMGTHGASGFKEFWAGSNAYHIVTHSPCPVITVRGTYHKDDITKIVMPIDSTKYTRHKVPFTSEIAKALNAEVLILGMYVEDFDDIQSHVKAYASQAGQYLDLMGVKNSEYSATGDNPAKMAIDFAQKNNAEMISIMTEQITSLENTILGPYAQQMVHHSSIPILSMHHNTDLETDLNIM